MNFAKIQPWFRSILDRRKLVTEMEKEISFHLEARTADSIGKGLSLKEAARRARLEFGTVAAHVKTMLYGLSPADPVSLIGTELLLLAVARIAGWVPAMRASRAEPMEALRHE